MSGNKPVVVALLSLKLINHSRRNQRGEQKLMEMFLSRNNYTMVVSMFVVHRYNYN